MSRHKRSAASAPTEARAQDNAKLVGWEWREPRRAIGTPENMSASRSCDMSPAQPSPASRSQYDPCCSNSRSLCLRFNRQFPVSATP
ncbi:hypothetical protein HaLaN_09854, partial [Haematococcus lacustris]